MCNWHNYLAQNKKKIKEKQQENIEKMLFFNFLNYLV